jgi:hypothetical protein
MIKVNLHNFEAFNKDLKNMTEMFESLDLQMHRGKRFREFTINQVSRGSLGLKPISSSTRIIHRKNHPPEWNDGSLVSSMQVRASKKEKNAAEVGFFEDFPNIPGKEITITEAAILQHTGYRIPLTGEKGERVRGWLARQGVFNQRRSPWRSSPIKSGGWITVSPRPFIPKTVNAYISGNHDVEAIIEWLNTKKGGIKI